MLIGSRDESFQSNLSYLLLKGLGLGLGNLGSYIDPPFPALVQLMSKYSSEASDSGTFRTMGTPCPSTLCLKTCILSVRKPVPTHYGSKLREHRPTTCLHRLTCFRLTSCQTVVRARLHFAKLPYTSSLRYTLLAPLVQLSEFCKGSAPKASAAAHALEPAVPAVRSSVPRQGPQRQRFWGLWGLETLCVRDPAQQ